MELGEIPPAPAIGAGPRVVDPITSPSYGESGPCGRTPSRSCGRRTTGGSRAYPASRPDPNTSGSADWYASLHLDGSGLRLAGVPHHHGLDPLADEVLAIRGLPVGGVEVVGDDDILAGV